VVVFSLCYLAFSTIVYHTVSPGLATFALIGFLAMVNALFRRLVPHRLRIAAIAVTALWITWANSSLFKLQVDNLAYDERTRADLRCEEVARAPDGPQIQTLVPTLDSQRLVDAQESLDSWRARFGKARPKLAIVCCSGGGARAALWSATVLGWLDDELVDSGFR